MKIALVHRYYPTPSGVTNAVDCLKKELEKNNEITIFTAEKTNEKNTETIKGKSLKFYWNLYKRLKKENFDVIHTHSFPIAWVAPLLKTPIILTIHGHDKICWAENFFAKIKDTLVIMGRGLSYRVVDKIIAVSKVVKNNAVKNWKINQNKVSIIWNGIDIKRFKPIKVQRKDKKFRVFIYSSMARRKGFDKLISWMPKLIKEIPNIQIVVAGLGDIKLSKELKNYFDLLGQVPFNDMPKVFNSVDLVILPSVEEPFGLTAAEGMACGKAVIVSKQGGIADVINGKNGISSSFEDFPKNIILLSKNKKLRERMGRNAMKTVKEKLSSRIIAQKHLNFYKSVIQNK